MAWLLLLLAGLLEVAWVVGLKHADGFTRLGPSLLTAALMAGSLALLGLALRSLPLGTAYSVWTGIGTVGAVAFGVVFADEPADPLRLAAVGCIFLGIAVLKLTGSH